MVVWGYVMDRTAIGDLLRELREERGVTQETVAQELNVAQETISGWERGLWTPRPRMLRRLAAYYGVSETELLIVANWARTAEEARRIAESDEPIYDARDPRRELVALLPQLTDQHVRALIAAAEHLLREGMAAPPALPTTTERNGS